MDVAEPEVLVGGALEVPVAGGGRRRYVDLDAAATSSASPRVAAAVAGLLPWYSSVHRGAGWKSQVTSARYEAAREGVVAFVGADPVRDVALFCRNTTEALNLLAHRLQLQPDDVVLTTAVEHHANLLPWRRVARLRVVEVGAGGTFTVDDVVAALDQQPTPRVLALTGASNVTGWLPDVAAVAAAARERGVLVVLDAAQLAPHRPIDLQALGVDVVALSGHKMYAPFGAGALVGPRRLFAGAEPMIVGGGAVRAVSFDEVLWADTPDVDEAGTPNVLGAVALATAAGELSEQWPAMLDHERALTGALDAELAGVPGLRRLGPTDPDRLPVAAFTLADMPHGLVAARLSHEHGIGVRSGCFCAHPYLARLLQLSDAEVRRFHDAARTGDRGDLPGAVRASANRGTSLADVAALGAALRQIVATPEGDDAYRVDEHGDHRPR